MHPTFHNKALQTEFLKNGFVIIPSLLNILDIRKLLNVFVQYQQEYSSSFHASHFSSNIAYKKAAHHAIASIVFEKAEPYLCDYVPLFGNFMVKGPNTNTSLETHTDWTYLDEGQYNSVAIWLPLIDVNLENGCLGIIKSSHRITNSIRGPRIEESSRKKNEYWAKKYGTLLNMKAGDAVFYHHGLLHFSPSNKTNEIRPAINLTVVPEEAECLHYCIPEGASEIELYAVDGPDFYLNYNNFQRPETNSLINKIPPHFVKFLDERMKNFAIKRYFMDIKSYVHPKGWFS
jgi:hypothetical protein